jgi:hypothetical protein
MGDERASNGAGAPGESGARDESVGSEPADRRRFLLKAGVAGATAWVAPVVLSSPAFAAQSGPPSSTPPPGCIPCGSTALLNGSFETNGGAPWQFNQVPSFGSATVVSYGSPEGQVTPPSGAGTKVVRLTGPASVSQTLGVSPECSGRPFTLSFWAYVSPLSFPLRADVTFSGGQPSSPTFGFVSSGPFALLARHELTGTVPDGATSVVIDFVGDTNQPPGLVPNAVDPAHPTFVDLVDFTICA